jgi:quinol monooxygenase YgiN
MLIVQGTFHLEPADRDAFLAESADNMRIARGERGCLEYVLAADPLEPGRVILSERWESRADLDEHGRALGRRREEKAPAGGAAPVNVLTRSIVIYEIASSEQLG